ncbi:hypothetical protein ANCCAN_18174 [Ancylostoma caninum]|uniref:Uncharacterized protein n=1 Tax=Ancylostoma caninum TaxID=29170 RepID=A0A368FYY3_ANCCA|nr:hypothetical protein ANCCAN_18174 [Ancylostoma caninum]
MSSVAPPRSTSSSEEYEPEILALESEAADLARETENSARSTDIRDYSVDDTSATCDLSLDAPSSRALLPEDAATAAHRYEAENDDPRSREQLLRTPRYGKTHLVN